MISTLNIDSLLNNRWKNSFFIVVKKFQSKKIIFFLILILQHVLWHNENFSVLKLVFNNNNFFTYKKNEQYVSKLRKIL